MINEKDVEILLANLSTGTETEFANLLFNFMQAGLVDKDRFRELIIGARELAYEDGLWEVTEIIGDISEERDLYAYVPGTKKFNFIGHISVEI